MFFLGLFIVAEMKSILFDFRLEMRVGILTWRAMRLATIMTNVIIVARKVFEMRTNVVRDIAYGA